MALADSLRLIWQALTLQNAPYNALLQGDAGLRLALTVVFLAGLSQGLGQSVVLFANRVKPRRFVLSLLVSGLLFVFGYALLVASIWLVSGFVFGLEGSLRTALRTTGLAYAPYLLSFFVLTPYLGSFIGLLLAVWSLLALVNALQITLALSRWQVLVSALLGWLALQILQRTLGRPLQKLTERLRDVAAGTTLELDPRTLRELIGGEKDK